MENLLYNNKINMWGIKMKKIFIIKNKGLDTDIYNNANKSFLNKTTGYYNTLNDSANEKYLQENCQLSDQGNVLLLSYNDSKDTEIKEIFIGGDAVVNDKWNISYIMFRKLTVEQDKRAIQSIIDKIDLDINEDFQENTYIVISEMQSLYDELENRINSVRKNELNIERKFTEEFDSEKYVLCKLAQHDSQSLRVNNNEVTSINRSKFQRDRERVVNCKAFRRMVDKAQIFSANKGDYYRTRMTHTLEVNQISKAIAYALKINLDLTEAIALSHDLGHTPFGHQGERTLDYILAGKIEAGIVMPTNLLSKRVFGSFKHNYQSAKVLTRLEDKYVDFSGLDVSVQVVEGALKHTRLKNDIKIEDFIDSKYVNCMNLAISNEKCISATLEGQTVSIADEIAQRGHDVDDALTSGFMSIDELLDRLSVKKCNCLRKNIETEIESVESSHRLIANKTELKITRIVSCIVNYFVTDVIANSEKLISESTISNVDMKNEIQFVKLSDEAAQVNDYLEKIVQKKVICNCEVARADYNASEIIRTLFKKYYANPRLLHTGTLNKIFYDMLNYSDTSVSNSAINLSDGSIRLVNEEIEAITMKELCSSEEKIDDNINFIKRKILIRNIVDYIAGMTDGYAIEEYEKLK